MKSQDKVGRLIVPFRKVLDGILYVLRTGCQWKMIPSEFGSGSTCHRRFQQWVQMDIFKKIWAKLLEEHDNKIGIKLTWQSLDSISLKSPLGWDMTVGSSPVDRSKLGTKRHILTDKQGIPLSAIISSVSTNNIKLVTGVIDNSVIKRTFVSGKSKKGVRQRRWNHNHLCLDSAYQSK